MQTFILTLTFSLLALRGFTQVSNITTVAWEKLPTAVQQAIEVNTGLASINSVERGVEGGQVVYSVSVPNGDGQTRVLVRENGALVPPATNPTAQPIVAPVPEPEVVATPLPEGITRTNIGAQTVYNVVTEGALQSSQVQITPNAQVVSTVQVGPQGLVEMRKVPRAALPPLVERAVQSQTGPGEIVDIVRGTYSGQNIYDVVYQQNDERIKVRIAENGAVLQQSILSTEDARVIAVEPYIGYGHVPLVVQTTLSAAAGGNPVQSVRQEVVPGGVNYVATYLENGQPVSIRISQTGQLLK